MIAQGGEKAILTGRDEFFSVRHECHGGSDELFPGCHGSPSQEAAFAAGPRLPAAQATEARNRAPQGRSRRIKRRPIGALNGGFPQPQDSILDG